MGTTSPRIGMYPSGGGGHDDKALNTTPCGGPGSPAGCWATSTWLGLSKADLGSQLVVVEAVNWRWSTRWWTVIAGDGSGSPAATWQCDWTWRW